MLSWHLAVAPDVLISNVCLEASRLAALDPSRSLRRTRETLRLSLSVAFKGSSKLVVDAYPVVLPAVLCWAKALAEAERFRDASFDNLALQGFCQDQGYQYQLWLYCKAVKEIHRKKRVRGVVWLTKIAGAVELVSLS